MLLFRSEEHVERWCDRANVRRGESFSIEQAWVLAKRLYSDRLSLTWRRKTPDEYETMFLEAGLTSDFWRLRP
jgi:Alkylmercury lyase